MNSWQFSCGGSFADAAAFQKALWWYNGARDAGRMAIPRVMGAGELLAHGAFSNASITTCIFSIKRSSKTLWASSTGTFERECSSTSLNCNGNRKPGTQSKEDVFVTVSRGFLPYCLKHCCASGCKSFNEITVIAPSRSCNVLPSLRISATTQTQDIIIYF